MSSCLLLLLSLRRLVARKLAEEFPRRGYVWVLFKILSGDKKTGQSLQHDGALVHLFPVPTEVARQEAIQDYNRVVRRLLDVEAQGLRYLLASR